MTYIHIMFLSLAMHLLIFGHVCFSLSGSDLEGELIDFADTGSSGQTSGCTKSSRVGVISRLLGSQTSVFWQKCTRQQERVLALYGPLKALLFTNQILGALVASAACLSQMMLMTTTA